MVVLDMLQYFNSRTTILTNIPSLTLKKLSDCACSTKQYQENEKDTLPKGESVPWYNQEDVSLGLKGARLCNKEGKNSKS